MKKLWILIFLMTLALNPAFVSAYGDEKEHAGDAEHKGMMHHHEGMEEMHEQHAATLREAASALQGSRPDLATKLEEIAKMHESMHEGMKS